MKRFLGWDIDVKASTTMLGPKCSLPVTDNDYPLLHSLLGEETSSQSEVAQTGMKFFYHLCGSKAPLCLFSYIIYFVLFFKLFTEWI